MSEPRKYRIAEGNSLTDVKEQMNTLVDEGYKLHTFTAVTVQGEHILMPQYVAVMSLSSSTKYDDIKHLIDVQPNGVDAFLMDGWIVADSYSKFIRMVKKK